MKNNVRSFLLKLFSLIIAFVLVFPAELFASVAYAQKSGNNKKTPRAIALSTNADTGVDTSFDATKIEPDQASRPIKSEPSIDETEEYIVEKSASLSKTTGEISYRILVKVKDRKDDIDQIASFAINENTDLKDLKIEKVQEISSDGKEIDAKYTKNEPGIFAAKEEENTLGLTVNKPANDLVYYLSAKLTDQALEDIEDKSPILSLDMAISPDKNTKANYQARYALEIARPEESSEIVVNPQAISLKEVTEDYYLAKGTYTPESQNLFGTIPPSITWTDYILGKDDEEITYDLALDPAQTTDKAEISVEIYEAKETGYIQNTSLRQNLPYTDSIKLQIPQGSIAKISLMTGINKEAKAREFTFNGKSLANPGYESPDNEENKEGEEEDEDPLPEADDKEKAADKEEGKSEITAEADPETNEFVVDHGIRTEDTEKPQETDENLPSAIDLNKDSVIASFKDANTYHPSTEVAINNITSLLKDHNEDKISYNELFDGLSSQKSDLSKDDYRLILTGLLAGLNEDKYKAASINVEALLNELYQNEAVEENPEAQNTDQDPAANKEAKPEEPADQDLGEVATEQTDPIENTNTIETADPEEPELSTADKALESFDKALAAVKDDSKKPQEDDRDIFANLAEGVKGIFGQSNLAKADKELKDALEGGKSLEEIQDLLHELGDKYQLNRKDEAKLMANNEEAIKALIAKDADENFRPSMLMAKNGETSNLANKKFTIRTRFDTSNIGGPIQPTQFFKIHLDKKLKVNDPSTLEPITYNGRVIARPSYDSGSNVITYNIVGTIPENIQVPLNIPVDYNTANIPENQDFIVSNRISGLGVTDPKELPPEKIDQNGNPAGTIIEPGRNDVVKIIDPDGGPYRFDMDANASPVIENAELKGFNWTVRVTSDKNLRDLGYKINFTTVKGSGLGEIKSREPAVGLDDQLKDAFGINDSKHHNPTTNTQEITYNLYTPITEKQESYMLDISVALSEKDEVGAERVVANQGYPADMVERMSPNRVSMNNRTFIKGEFKSNNTAKWTITDGVSSHDTNKGLPLESRTLGNQTFDNGKRASYGLDSNGRMVVKEYPANFNKSLPSKESNPSGSQPVGTIAVYEVNTNLNNPNIYEEYSVSGVRISKYRDLEVDQYWGLPNNYQKMPKQTITVKDKANNELGKKKVDPSNGYTRSINIPNVKYWNIDGNGKATMIDHKITQTFDPQDVNHDGKTYRYNEVGNYYNQNLKNHYIYNRLDEYTNTRPATFTVIKVDSKDPTKRLAGASYYLLGAGVEVATDANGQATFSNIQPGSYTLKETQAPAGYKLDQDDKYITIANDGSISVSGRNVQYSSGAGNTEIVEHDAFPNWRDFMNTQHYGKVDANGKLEFYAYLKPYGQRVGGTTDKNTTFNISIPGVNLTNANVQVYDVDPSRRDEIFNAMNSQTVDRKISGLGQNLIGQTSDWSETITGRANAKNPLSGQEGYQIGFPSSRFGTDWGFLVKVSANIGNKESTTLFYDWLAEKDPAGQAKIRQSVNLSKNQITGGNPTLTITNEEFKKSEIAVAKFDNSKSRLQGAEFELKDTNGRVLATVTADKNGDAKFGSFPTGTYYLEESKAPAGYEKSSVYFIVTVDEEGKVTYRAKFQNSDATPTVGVDYFYDRTESDTDNNPIRVTKVTQDMSINDAEGRGYFTGIWEAYRLESLKWVLDAKLENVSPGKTLEIQFDRNLDFTQYFRNFPDIVSKGKVIAEPNFNYKTNLLTYVFNDNSKDQAQTSIHIELKGMIPSKFYQLDTGRSDYTNIVAPGTSVGSGNQSQTVTIPAYYEGHDNHVSNNNNPYKQNALYPSQSYYFRDIYQADDGQWYVKAIAYYNPLGNYKYTQNKPTNNIYFNWIFTDWDDAAQPKWVGKYEAPFDLRDVKVYRTNFPGIEKAYPKLNDPDKYAYINRNMPLSYGVVPENDPNTYELVYSGSINPKQASYDSQGDISVKYDPRNIKADNKLTFYGKAPLQLIMPQISSDQEGYVIEQTFSIRDINAFNSHWRAFSMTNGPGVDNNTSLKSTFVNAPNRNLARGDQVGVEIPKTFTEVVGLINRKYEPGSFKITKLNATDKTGLQGASFSLKNENGDTIIRTSASNGLIEFNNLAPGRYTLSEIQAPEGYVKTDQEWQVTVYRDGYVRIDSLSILGDGGRYFGKDTINITVENKPKGQDFRIYKKDDQDKGLEGAVFTLTKEGDTTFKKTKRSNANGLVTFGSLADGTYIIEETKAPDGYKPSNQKWVLVIDKDGKKVYNYSQSESQEDLFFLKDEGTYRVNVKERSQAGWSYNDNRRTGWTNKSTVARYMGTRIIAINKDKKYVIQRYVINPEAADIDGITAATIHREKPHYQNMDWYAGNEKYKVFTLGPKKGGNTDGKVTGLISDLRLADYTVTDITSQIKKETVKRSDEDIRLQLKDFPKTNKPVVIDVKVPYKDENGGVGTGMDVLEHNSIYWKSDYYERVSDIKLGNLVKDEIGTIVGSYIGDDSLDVTNEPKTYGFKIKKVKEGAETQVVPGATFTLTGGDLAKEGIEVTSDKNGVVEFVDLKPGIYQLEETEAAPGYEKTDKTWTVTIDKEGKAYIKENGGQATGASTNSLDTSPESPRPSLMAARSANLDLEMGDEIVPGAQMAGQDNLQANTYTVDASNANINVSAGAVDLSDGTRDINVKITPKNQKVGPNKSHWVLLIDRSKDFSTSNYDNNIDNNINMFLTDLRDKADTPGAEVYVSIIKYSPVKNDNGVVVDRKNIKDLDSAILYQYNRTRVDGSNNLVEDHPYARDYLSAIGIGRRNGNTGDGARFLSDTVNGNINKITQGDYDNKYVINFAGFNANGVIKTNTEYEQFKSMNQFHDKGYSRIYLHVDPINGNYTTNITAYQNYIASNTEKNALLLTQTRLSNNKPAKDYGPYLQKPFLDELLNDKSNFEAKGEEVSLLKNGHLNIATKNNVVLNSYAIKKNGSEIASQINPSSISQDISLNKGESLEVSYRINLDSNANIGQDYTIHSQMNYKPDTNANNVNLDINNLLTRRNQARKYKIDFYSMTNGSVSVDNNSVPAGSNVTLNVDPAEDYEIDELYYRDGNSTNPHPISGNTFIMPNSDIMVYATFKQKPPTSYDVEVLPSTNGKVIASPASALAGKQISLTITPDANYELDTLQVTDAKGNTVSVDSNNTFTMPKSKVTVSATFKEKPLDPPEGSTEIPADGYTITNKQTGLDLRIFKKDKDGRSLKDASFTLEKYRDKTYTDKDSTFQAKTIKSDENGLVKLVDEEGNAFNLKPGYYRLTEETSPLGYKKSQAPWDIEVKEENGQLVAAYRTAEHSDYDYVHNPASYDKASIQTASNGIKYKSKLTYINTETKTYVQRIYIDTRGYTGSADQINIQITPKHKREEIDIPGVSPITYQEGVKTAYRSTYKITGEPTGDEEAFAKDVLENYDLSKNNVSMINTARWRPFDWGFDEDIMNLDKGSIYYIDVEGFYDDAIITGMAENEVFVDKANKYERKTDSEGNLVKVDPYRRDDIKEDDLKKLQLDIDFYDGPRYFQQAVNVKNNGEIEWSDGKNVADAYLLGNVTLGYVTYDPTGKTKATPAGEFHEPRAKYPKWLGKDGGRIYPAIGKNVAKTTVSTSIDLKTLYAADKFTDTPKEGMTLLNDKEVYNITFTKHGMEEGENVNSKDVTERRLEGAIFRLERDLGSGTYVPVAGSYVASAFNGYFGFRGLEPGRYRLMEEKAPKDYKPINGPLLYFTIKTINAGSGEVVDPETGDLVDIKKMEIIFESGSTDIYKLSQLETDDPDNPGSRKSVNDIDSEDINIKTLEVYKPGTNDKVKLENLIVVGRLKYNPDLGGEARSEYPIKNIKIVPKSSGYISLEYDEANGVYQYLPDQATSVEKGQLIDFVTSATAKNMGKIINEKPGKGRVEVEKVDQTGKPLEGTSATPGAEFKLINQESGSVTTLKADENGKLAFEDLQIGNYRLVESKSPEGYVNTGQVWNFTVGGESLDPYSGPIAPTGRDLSNQITLETTELKVNNPQKKTSVTVEKGKTAELHPHVGESLEFTNKYHLAEGIKINPGDFFVLNVSDKMDLNGIFENDIESMDILAPGVGTIAKANYNRAAGTITYTFTDYAKTYTLIEFSNKLTGFINLEKVTKSDGPMSSQKLGFGINKNDVPDTSQYRPVRVVYDLDYAQGAKYNYTYNNWDQLNLVSKIVSYGQETGDFVHYYYVNRKGWYANQYTEFLYKPRQDVENLRIEYKNVTGQNMDAVMPESFGITDNSGYTTSLYQGYLQGGGSYLTGLYFPGEAGLENDQYIIKVTGRVVGPDKSEYFAEGVLVKYYNDGGDLGVQRHDEIYAFRNEATADAKFEIKVVNPENKIIFKKQDQEANPIKDATFQLQYRAKESDDWTNYGEVATSNADGRFEYSKLKVGYYQLKELSAPNGYLMEDNPVASFQVDKNGRITRKVVVRGKENQEIESTEEITLEPVSILNKKEHEIKFKKVDSTNKEITLAEAEFEVLYKESKDATEYKKLKLYQRTVGDETQNFVLKDGEKAPRDFTEVQSFKTGADGLVKFKFFDQGYYAIKETKAPKGYITPKENVKEFSFIDGKLNVVDTEKTGQFVTEVNVDKTNSWVYTWGFVNTYKTNISMKYNTENIPVTYKKGDKLTLSGLPKASQPTGDRVSSQPISIRAYLTDGKNNSNIEYISMTLRDYNGDYATKEIDLYDLVKKLEGKTEDGDISSTKTLVLSMESQLYKTTEFDLGSKLVIGDKTEENTWHIGTKGHANEDHSCFFTTKKQEDDGGGYDPSKPVEIKNKKATYPATGGSGVFKGFAILGTALMLLGLAYYGLADKKRLASRR